MNGLGECQWQKDDKPHPGLEANTWHGVILDKEPSIWNVFMHLFIFYCLVMNSPPIDFQCIRRAGPRRQVSSCQDFHGSLEHEWKWTDWSDSSGTSLDCAHSEWAIDSFINSHNCLKSFLQLKILVMGYCTAPKLCVSQSYCFVSVNSIPTTILYVYVCTFTNLHSVDWWINKRVLLQGVWLTFQQCAGSLDVTCTRFWSTPSDWWSPAGEARLWRPGHLPERCSSADYREPGRGTDIKTTQLS